MVTPNKIRVRFAVADDEQAAKITALLDALGYEAIREIDDSTAQTRLRWAIHRLAQRTRLTGREQDIVALVLDGLLNPEIAEHLEITRSTVKWHMHNIFTKTGTTNREGLIREALQLGGVRRPPVVMRDDAKAEDDDSDE
jgi:DNA-binding CsgD family transcriptional regulator